MESGEKSQKWFAVEIHASAEASEALEYAFNSLDSLGTEINYLRDKDRSGVTVAAYFDEMPDDERLRDEIHYALRVYGLNEDVVEYVRRSEIANADWLQEWKKHWKPTTAGRFVIAPPWEAPDDPDKVVIRIEPNMAFGTGTHETTQLCLKAIDECYKPSDSFLDVGTGTGILAIAAAKMANAATCRILACDIDAEAVEIARENARINGVIGLIEFASGPLTADAPVFDFVCANLTADVIVQILPLLLEKTGKTLVLSGILAEQEPSLRSALRELNVEAFEIEQAGEWIAVRINCL